MTIITVVALAAAAASANTNDLKSRMGINLSGCEFEITGTLCPSAADIDWYLAQGFGVIRLPIRTTTLPAKLYPVVDRIIAKGGRVILDRHEFAWPSVSNQVAFWGGIAGRYKNDARVLIDVANEPKGFNDPKLTNDWMQWVRDGNAIIAGLRAKGINNIILLEWPQYSAAFRLESWETAAKQCQSAGCALDRSGGLKDPLGRTLLSPHLYFDRWSSGTEKECALPLQHNLTKTRIAAAKRGLRLWLGESAFGSYKGVPASCVSYGKTAIAEIKGNPATWAGVSWWGGGRFWGDSYIYKVEPKKGTRATAAASGYLRTISGK
jgi:endoglucanase